MDKSQSIRYETNIELDLDEVIRVYRDSTLGERRPVDNRECMTQMIKEANLIVTAWSENKLVGISRTMTDFCYVAYLADLAVDKACQRQGIGVELIRHTRLNLGPRCMIVLLAAPAAVDYYPRIGFRSHPQAWILRAEDELAS